MTSDSEILDALRGLSIYLHHIPIYKKLNNSSYILSEALVRLYDRLQIDGTLKLMASLILWQGLVTLIDLGLFIFSVSDLFKIKVNIEYFQNENSVVNIIQ